MPIDPDNTSAVRINSLPTSPPLTANQATRQQVKFGTDHTYGGSPTSYQLTAEELRDLLAFEPDQSFILEVPGHGQPALPASQLPRPAFINTSGDVVTGNTATAANLPSFFITEIIDTDFLRVQLTGILKLPQAHGQTVGTRLYLQDNASLSSVPASGISLPVFFVLSADTLALLQLREQIVVGPTPGRPQYVDTVAEMALPGVFYRLRQADTVGAEQAPPGLYLLEEDSTVQHIETLPPIVFNVTTTTSQP